jgi:hypothetical protein
MHNGVKTMTAKITARDDSIDGEGGGDTNMKTQSIVKRKKASTHGTRFLSGAWYNTWSQFSESSGVQRTDMSQRL